MTTYIRALPGLTGGPEIEWVRADFTKDLAAKRKKLPERWRRQGTDEAVIQRAVELCEPTGNVFLDLCLLRGGFPSARRRFCTDYLKLRPVNKLIYKPVIEAGDFVCAYTGVRADESFARSTLPFISKRKIRGLPHYIYEFRPLLKWEIRDVMDCLARHGIKPNPLYERGVQRVGCWPCIFSRKAELRAIAETDPAALKRIIEWEKLVTSAYGRKGNIATMLPARDIGKRPFELETHGMKARIAWSKTARGGRQYTLLREENSNVVMEEFHAACDMHGRCE